MTAKKNQPTVEELQTQLETTNAYVQKLEQTVGSQSITIARLETNLSLLQKKVDG